MLGTTAIDWVDVANKINSTLLSWANATLPAGVWTPQNFTDSLTRIAQSNGDNFTIDEGYDDILGTVGKIVAEGFGVEVQPGYSVNTIDGNSMGISNLIGILDLYSTVYLYFFISAGLALIILACLFMLGQKAKTRIEWMSIGLRLLIGTGLTLLAAINAVPNGTAFGNFLFSPWLTPTVALTYALGKSNGYPWPF
jgi:hypothetical protein